MPLLLALAVVLGMAFAIVFMVPVSLVMRYRAGKSRRQARGWAASMNIAILSFSIALFLAAASMTTFWAPGAHAYTLGGLAAGGLLGVAGLALSRWEATPRALHVTPNAWLVLFVTVVVSARLAYGVWRTWHAWNAGLDHTSQIVASGLRGSLAAGGIVLGYYFTFWIGVLRRIRRHQRAAAAATIRRAM